MKGTLRNWMLAAAHLALALSVTGKFIYDRQTLPRTWVRTLPYDPNLPLRGRYVRLRIDGFAQPIAYFIPENIPDPSIRKPNEELWVEVSLPEHGLPRPIQLGVKTNGGEIVPLKID